MKFLQLLLKLHNISDCFSYFYVANTCVHKVQTSKVLARDSHCEVNKDWLPPLLQRVKKVKCYAYSYCFNSLLSISTWILCNCLLFQFIFNRRESAGRTEAALMLCSVC